MNLKVKAMIEASRKDKRINELQEKIRKGREVCCQLRLSDLPYSAVEFIKTTLQELEEVYNIELKKLGAGEKIIS
jgi:hypothetical protein